jgi:hypothetical protein
VLIIGEVHLDKMGGWDPVRQVETNAGRAFRQTVP